MFVPRRHLNGTDALKSLVRLGTLAGNVGYIKRTHRPRVPITIVAAHGERDADATAPVELTLEHGMEKFANPIAQASFDRIEPVADKMHSGSMRRGIAMSTTALPTSWPKRDRSLVVDGMITARVARLDSICRVDANPGA